jgi:hypothetical protein
VFTRFPISTVSGRLGHEWGTAARPLGIQDEQGARRCVPLFTLDSRPGVSPRSCPCSPD